MADRQPDGGGPPLTDTLLGPMAAKKKNIHSILKHARAVLPPSVKWPPSHRGETTPAIGARGWSMLAVFLARRYEHLLTTPAERKLFDATLADAQKLLVKRATTKERAGLKDTTAIPLILARAAWKEADVASRKPDMVGGSLRPAVVKTVKHVLETEGQPKAVELVLAIDEELRRLDVVHAVFERWREQDIMATAERAVFRGAIKGKPTLWLAQMPKNRLGLVWKNGTRWAWLEDTRDVVLGTVPDAFFEAATMAASNKVSV